MAGRLRLPYAAGLVVAAVLGSALALGGAALLGGFDGDTTTILKTAAPAVAAQVPVNEATATSASKALTVNEIYRRAAPGVVQVTATEVVKSPSVDPFTWSGGVPDNTSSGQT